jgi:Ser/Thr protein kinase RdoA (MazF antagonist)
MLPTDDHSYGLIHGDFELDSLIWDGERAQALDFDAAVYAWYAADIAIALQDVWAEAGAKRARRLAWFTEIGQKAPGLDQGMNGPLLHVLYSPLYGSVLACSSDQASRTVGPGRPVRRERSGLPQTSPEHPPPSAVGSVKKGYATVRPLPNGLREDMPRFLTLIAAHKVARLLLTYATTPADGNPAWVATMCARHEQWLEKQRAALTWEEGLRTKRAGLASM